MISEQIKVKIYERQVIRMGGYESALRRRSVREYLEKPVERELLIKLLEAGAAAPSAVNRCPWEFLMLTEDERMEELRGMMRFGKYNAPAAIIVCCDLNKVVREFVSVQDCFAATENILNAAPDFGLGTVWLSAYGSEELDGKMRAAFGLPEHVRPTAVIYVGYPQSEPESRTQLSEENIHWEKY